MLFQLKQIWISQRALASENKRSPDLWWPCEHKEKLHLKGNGGETSAARHCYKRRWSKEIQMGIYGREMQGAER